MSGRALFEGLLRNRVLLSAVAGWFFAQLAKTALYGIINREWRLERLIGSGGMPSSHAATVCALVVAVVYNYGTGSFEFAISTLFAIIVLHDARGVRYETGKQAEIINTLYEYVQEWQELEKVADTRLPDIERLKVLVGHTPLQVLIGGLMGILTGILLH